MEAAAVNRSYVHAAIIGDDEAIGIFRIDPDVMGVAAPMHVLKVDTAVERLMEGAVRDENLVVITRGNGNANVISGAADERALPINSFPLLAHIIGTPHRALIFCLDEGVHAIGVGGRNRYVDLANGRLRQAVLFDFGPLRA